VRVSQRPEAEGELLDEVTRNLGHGEAPRQKLVEPGIRTDPGSRRGRCRTVLVS
jgi:hypothetical protein